MTTCAEKLRIKGRPSKVQSDTHSGQGSLLSKDEVAVTLKGGIEICQKIMY